MINFSHIYAETKALGYSSSKEVLDRFPQAQLIEIDDYRDIFNRNNQNWSAQKKSQKLILAVQQDKFYYEGSPNCNNFGHKNFYYSSPILNCPFDCSYCYLQGLFNSANLVYFVNSEDYLNAISNLQQERPQLLLCLSYDTDLIALDPILPTLSNWLTYAKQHPSVTLEIRTKAANCSRLFRHFPLSNVILAWTLSPQVVIDKYEGGSAPLSARLQSITQAVKCGCKVRICLDPILPIPEWEFHYQQLIEDLFSTVKAEELFDISVGVFRMNLNYFKKLKKRNLELDFIHYDWQCQEGTVTHSTKLRTQLQDQVVALLEKYLSPQKIFFLDR